MRQIDDKLLKIIEKILNNEDSEGCSDGLTVTTKDSCDCLREYMDEYSEQF